MSTEDLVRGLQSALGSFAQAREGRLAREQRQKELDLGYRAQGLIGQYDDQGNVAGLIKDPEFERQKQDEYKRDIMTKAALEGREAQFDEQGLLAKAPRSQDELGYLKQKEQSNPMTQMLQGFQLQKAQKDAEQANKGFKLPPDKVLSVQQGSQIPTQLDEIAATIEANKKSFDPISGRMASYNPYNEKSQSIDAQMRASAQAFGRYMEGGVLRKEDEDKYKKMFPSLSDTPQVAENKLAIVRKLLVDKQNADIQALKDQGYDVSGFKSLAPSELPGLLKGVAPKKAEASSKPKTIKQNGVTYTLNPQTGEYE